jgi:hypothetical protein
VERIRNSFFLLNWECWLVVYLFRTAPRLALGSSWLPIQWLWGAVSVSVKQPEREADELDFRCYLHVLFKMCWVRQTSLIVLRK